MLCMVSLLFEASEAKGGHLMTSMPIIQVKVQEYTSISHQKAIFASFLKLREEEIMKLQ